MTTAEAIKIYLTNVKDEIFLRQERNGMRASGRSAETAKVVVTRKSGYIDAEKYLPTNFKGIGRKPGEMPPIKSIEQWIAIKHLSLNAWAVAKSIAKKGTRVFYDRRRGIDMESIQEKYREQFVSDLMKVYKDKLTRKK